MNPFPYMPLYWNDLLSDNKVRIMSNEELGAYVRLLGAAWHEDIPGTLPDNEEDLSRFAGVEPSLWRKLSRRVLACFVLDGETGRYVQKRMAEEYRKLAAKSAARKAAGALGGMAKAEHQKQPASNARILLEQKSSSQSQNHSQSQRTEKREAVLPLLEASAATEQERADARSLSAGADPPAPPGKLMCSDVVKCWNTQAHLPKVQTLNGREHLLRSRMREPFFVSNYAAAIERIARSRFCLGAVDGRGWRATFDWLIRADTIAKVMEGKYDDKPADAPKARQYSEKDKW